MKRKQFFALILALLFAASFAGCDKGKKDQTATAETENPAATETSKEPAATEIVEEPEEEEVILVNEPEKDSPKTNAALSDGTYHVNLEREQTQDEYGRLWASFVLLNYVELPDAEVSALKPGDTVQLPEYSFVIVGMQTDEGMGYREIRFNDGTERCYYIEDTNTWRFTWPNDEPYLVEGERYAMPLAVDVILTDELTPLAEGRNVYGVPNDGNDPTIGALDLLEDFFRHYPGMESEQASITVRNGEIAEVLVDYHP